MSTNESSIKSTNESTSKSTNESMTRSEIEAAGIDEVLLGRVRTAVEAAGAVLRDRYTTHARARNLTEIFEELQANDNAVLPDLERRLLDARPGSQWVDDELATGTLPDGEWWIVDPAEGNINHVHGMPEWAVTATLMRDNRPVLTVVHLPLTGDTYTAIAGHGAARNGETLRVSAKTGLDAGLVATSQAQPDEDQETYRRIGESVSALLTAGLVVRVSVPATLQLVNVAAGRMEAFWQYSEVRSGLVSGALLVTEAGGLVTDLRGEPWTPGHRDFLAAAPGVHRAVSEALAPVK
ncbi:myo-inositol-1(or 4)-monophosphatase [Streptomyces sp. B3I8]|nr:inositol monophosphatase family protein [Streptomyces sp. B3I8]MDQ0791245.1 myo-inositol-1(or 4)-monophosphatase [Streptomyces sp. B3I8]